MLRVGDLFAGVGGMSQGFKMAGGFDVTFAIEYDAEIAGAYRKNHIGTNVYAMDIKDADVEELSEKYPDIDVIIGGPPCQGFSQKGKRLSLFDQRNYLFQQYVRFVEKFRPKYFVLENVPNIITTANGFFKNQIIEAFSHLGYEVAYGILCAADYGVPQDRNRAFFVGQLHRLQIGLPVPSKAKTTLKEAIYDLPFIPSGGGAEIMAYDKKPFSDYQVMMRKNSKAVYNHTATNHSATALRRLAMIPKGAGKEVLPLEERTKSIYSGTWSRMIEDDVSVTITTRFDTPSSGRFTHPVLDRCITTREAARIQSFPDTFRFYGSKNSQMKQVGNAVPPLLAKAVAEQILKNEI